MGPMEIVDLFFEGLISSLRKENKKLEKVPLTKVSSYFPTFLLVGTIVTLIIASFFPSKPELTNGIICISYFVVGLAVRLASTKSIRSLKKYLTEKQK